ncbi:MFS transporter [Pseudolysinimonas sp.]|uniref:MFS transporter n=1 Tax=Pseudolysinimonas sp. TaxID=2680009 RepID=UPI003F7E69EC
MTDTPTSAPTRAPGRDRLTPQARRSVLASFVGSTFEWYDFGLYGTTAALVFNRVFFPTTDPAVGTLLALVTTAVGYFTRPIGGIIFGHFGDRVGRKRLLVITMLGMGIPTLVIGMIPSYATIGVAAPILLLLMRLLQGIGLGGEYAGAALATIESVPGARRGFFGSIPQLGNPVGGVLGSLLVLACTFFAGDEVFAAWLWRVPFLLSAILLAYALVVRLRLVETGDFRKLAEEKKVVKAPLVAVVRHHWAPLLLGMGARAADAITGNVAGGVTIAYIVTYLKQTDSVSLVVNIVPSIIAIPLMLGVGALSDRSGRRRTYVIALLILAVTVFPMFALLDTRIVFLMIVGITIFRLANSAQFAVQSAFLADIFPTEVRYTAISLVYQVTSIIGGLTPPLALAILIATGGSPWLLCIVVAVVVALSALCAGLMRSRVRPETQQIAGPIEGLA